MLTPVRSVPLTDGYNLVRITPGPSISRLGPSDFADEDKLTVLFETDVNLLILHQQILSRFNERKQKCKGLSEKVKNLKLKMACSNNISEAMLSAIEREIISLENKIDFYSNDSHLSSYLYHTKELLDQYNIMGPKLRVVTFGEEEAPTSSSIEPERLSIIQKFLDIVEYYVPLNVVRSVNEEELCLGCGKPFKDLEVNAFGKQSCACGSERDAPYKIHKSISKINNTGTNDYEALVNFMDAIERYTGKHKDKPPKSVYLDLDKFFSDNTFMPAEEIKKKPLIGKEREGTSFEIMFIALKRTGHSDQYKNIHVIVNIYWGYPLADLSAVEQRIIQDFKDTQVVYNRIKDKFASMYVWYRLCRHLQSRNFPCSKKEFRMITTPSIADEYEGYWKQMTSEAKIPYKPLT